MLPAQFLSWEYENIVDDIQQSGANPSMAVDAQGNLHISAWQQEFNQLTYSIRHKATGQWQHEILDPEHETGYKSAIVVDSLGKVHIAYFQKNGSQAFLKYATNASGSWTYESLLPGEPLGGYGPNLDFPVYAQASVSISLQKNGQPFVSVFDASVNGEGTCYGNLPIYVNYDLKLRATARMPDGSWQTMNLPAVPFTDNPSCLLSGDRHGEFCKSVRDKLGRMYILTNSVHNHQLLLFRSEPNDLSSWSYTVLDSLQRLGTVKNSGGSNQFRETFDFMDMINPNDSVLHLVYGVSDLYGFNDISPKIRRTFFYTRIVIDSLGSSTYTPYHFDFVIPRDGQLRNNFSITSTDDQHIGIAYYDLKNAAVAIKFSADAGQSWSTDTLLEVNIQSPLQTASFGDSLYVLTYDAQKDFQILSSRSRLHAQWQHRPASIQEKRGRAFHSRVQRIEPGRDDIEMVFTEEWRDQLFYGKRTDGNWTYEGVDVAGKKVKEAAMTQNGQGQACAAYVFQATEELKFACKTPGGWQSQLVDGNSKARDIDLAARADSLFLVYFDLATGSLKYARSAGGSQWLVQTLDDSSPIVGLDPKLHIDAQGNKHLAYSDAINQRLKYAFQPPGGAWQLSSITEAFAYQPEQIELLTDSLNRPVLAFRNAFSNQIVLAEQKDGGWQLQVAREGGVSFLGNPFRLLLDAKDRPWIVYNFSDVFDEIRLTRRDAQGSWQDVSIIGNTGRIANSFDFHLVEKDFYIIGKKNARGDQGLAMLYAFEGVTTDLLAPSPGALQAWKLYPNPASSVVNISLELEAATPLHLSLYDLQGRQLAAEALPGLFAPGARQLGWQLPRLQPGMYLLRLQGKGFDAVKKLLIH